MRAWKLVWLAGLALATPVLAADTNPAAFPDKAQAILLSGSTEARFTNDVNSMTTVFTDGGNRWQYGASNVKTLTYAGAGANKASWANLETAVTGAALNMWTKPAREQNFVYVHSSHGLPGDDGSTVSSVGSQMMFGEGAGGGARSSVDFRNLIRDKLRSGHTEFSSDGSSTSCVRTMSFLLEPCYSGGQIYELTERLPTKENRRKYFPALSDVTVMTAGRYDECTYGLPDDSGNRFMRELYGYGATAGTLQGMDARNAWDVYRTAAQRNIANDGAAWVPDYTFGSGNNSVMHVRSNAFDGRAVPEHNLYRHVEFYPSITFGEAEDGRVVFSNANPDPIFDFRLNGAHRPLAGPLPITLSFVEAFDGGSFQADRDKLPAPWLGALNIAGLQFVDYYTFNLTNNNNFQFLYGSLNLAMEMDDVAAAMAIGQPRLFQNSGSGWFETGAPFDGATGTFSLGNFTSLGTFAVVVPAPGAAGLLGVGLIFVARRRR